MKRFWRKNKFYFEVASSLFLATIVLMVGFKMSFTSIDLNKVQHASGAITDLHTEQTKGSKPIPGSKDLVLKIDNDEVKYLIFRASQNYSNIILNAPIGSIVKIYFDNYRERYNDYRIYQLEINKNIIYNKAEYENQEKSAARFIALPLGLIMLYMVYLQFKKRYRPKILFNQPEVS